MQMQIVCILRSFCEVGVNAVESDGTMVTRLDQDGDSSSGYQLARFTYCPAFDWVLYRIVEWQ
jgi:hypothetical protein